MPYIVPTVAIGSAIYVFIWGVKKLINKDDSADRRVAEFIKNLPAEWKKHIKKVSIDEDQFIIEYKENTTTEKKNEIQSGLEQKE